MDSAPGGAEEEQHVGCNQRVPYSGYANSATVPAGCRKARPIGQDRDIQKHRQALDAEAGGLRSRVSWPSLAPTITTSHRYCVWYTRIRQLNIVIRLPYSTLYGKERAGRQANHRQYPRLRPACLRLAMASISAANRPLGHERRRPLLVSLPAAATATARP